MSLHRYIVPPPLALAVHPAPPSKPKVSDKDKNKGKDKDQMIEKNKSKDKSEDGKVKDKVVDENKESGNENEKVKDKTEKKDGKPQAQAEADSPPSPATPGSMLPEPPTPAPGADVQGAPNVAAAAVVDGKKTNEAKVPAPNQAKPDQEITEKSKDNPVKYSDDKDNDDEEEEDVDVDVKIEPLRLLPPAPSRPPRTKLDLNPSIPYPPINSDPRGAYNKYAKAFNAISDYHHIDLTKDGWLFPIWKGRAEREALAHLRGEAEKTVEREAQKAWGRRVGARKVPETSEGVLLDLWNDLVDSDHHELQVDTFWARYDWSTPEARIHLLDIKRVEDKPEAEAHESHNDDHKGEKTQVKTSTVNGTGAEGGEVGPDQVHWTKEGVEEILGVVGVRCDYNLQKPIKHPHWSEPTSALLLLAHDHFLLRLDLAVKWQKEKPSTDFQVLVVDHHDRVFGEMVKARLAEERKKRKEKEKEKEAAEKVKDGKSNKENNDKDVKSNKQDDKDGNSNKSKSIADKVTVKVKDDKDEASTPTSNAKVQNGEEVKAANVNVNVIEDNEKKDVYVLAVDVEGKDGIQVEQGAETKTKERDDKHDDADEVEKGKVVVVNGIDGDENKGQADLKDISKAVNALQVANDVAKDPAVPINEEKAGSGEAEEEKKEPLIWTWSEKCEKWRWRNWEQGVHVIGPGGWEERDWKVFADDREVWDWEKDEAEIEIQEEDLHDWSC